MKKYFIISLSALTLAACSPKDPAKKLESLKAEKDKVHAELVLLQLQEDSLQNEIDKLKNTLDTAKDIAKAQVKVLTLATGNFSHSVEIQGLVYSENNVTLAAENGGKVMKVYVKEGDNVTQGQKLADLDGGILESQLAELNTRLELAAETYKKQDALWKKRIGTEMQYLQAKNNYEALKNQKNTVTQQVSKFHLTAPFSGVIDEVFLREGEVSAPGTPAIRLVNLNNIEVKADVSEKYVGAFKKGDKVSVYFPALRDTVQTTITAVGNVINPNNRTFTLHIALNNKNHTYKPNLLALIEASDFSATEAISVPAKLVQTEGKRKFVFLAVQQDSVMVAQERTIETGPNAKGQILVSSGLNAGDQVVNEGYLNLEDGDVLDIIK
ncbi:MAG: efflux RND transporter periplasmic adaptor subunit [Bacteroidetes bacterium]|nr:MAG: efflux RND transporter periplasmic adaptor subunit [Bacteroidota bacterium]